MSDTSPLLFRDNLPASIQDGILESNVNSVSIQARELVQGNSTSFGAVFIVINAAMGAGLLAFPYAFFLAGGWQWGIVVQLVSNIIFLPLFYPLNHQSKFTYVPLQLGICTKLRLCNIHKPGISSLAGKYRIHCTSQFLDYNRT